MCLTAVHAGQLDDYAPAVRRALTLLARLPGAPTRAVEWRADAVSVSASDQFYGTKPTAEPGTAYFRLQFEFGVRRSSPSDVTVRMLNGAGTWMNGCTPGDGVALGAAGAWLMGVDVLPLDDDTFPYTEQVRARISATVQELRELPEPERIRRVTALRDAAGACSTGDLLSILTGRPST